VKFTLDYPYWNSKLYTGRKCSIKVNGTGTVKAVPDMAVINLGVVTEGLVLEAAQNENTTKSTEVISSLIGMGIPRKQIRTASYNIEPVYDYVEGNQVFKGYRVTNLLSITVTNLAEIGKIIDTATAAGANRVDSINFSISDPSVYYDRALNLAIKSALRKAYLIAEALGAQINEIPCKIIEEGSAVPMAEGPMLKLSAQSTPILPGQIEISARIEAVFQYK
jgi:uncharacterized protein